MKHHNKKNIIINGKSFNNVQIEENWRKILIKIKSQRSKSVLDYISITNSDVLEHLEKRRSRYIFDATEFTLSGTTYINCALSIDKTGKINIFTDD
jgi:hypothetical protein